MPGIMEIGLEQTPTPSLRGFGLFEVLVLLLEAFSALTHSKFAYRVLGLFLSCQSCPMAGTVPPLGLASPSQLGHLSCSSWALGFRWGMLCLRDIKKGRDGV